MPEDFKHTYATRARLLGRSCESLLGICQGVLADRVLNEAEVQFLSLWLREHEDIASVWPGCVVRQRVETLVANGEISPDESSALATVIMSVLGGTWVDSGAVDGFPTDLPIQKDVVVTLPHQRFCFTGKFAFGTRKACERAVAKNGGSTHETIVQSLDYLVIGTFVTPDWAHTSFGRKIEKAVQYRSQGCSISIVSEQQWCTALELI